MKTIKTSGILTLFLFILLILAGEQEVLAQGRGNANGQEVRAGGPPPWAPAHGYRAKTRYVYFRDYDVYYDHEQGVYISLAGRDWQVSAQLPMNLRGIDLNAAVKIDLDLEDDEPQRFYDEHRRKYPKKR